MTGADVPTPVIAAAVAAAGSLALWVLNAWFTDRRENIARQRDTFSKAFAVSVAYQEFPYVVRRRRHDEPEKERLRISDQLRHLQQELAYYAAWISTESPSVGQKYEDLISAVREVAGGYIRDAWASTAAQTDSEMNITDIDLSGLHGAEVAYITAVRDHLSPLPAWVLKGWRSIRKRMPSASKGSRPASS